MFPIRPFAAGLAIAAGLLATSAACAQFDPAFESNPNGVPLVVDPIKNNTWTPSATTLWDRNSPVSVDRYSPTHQPDCDSTTGDCGHCTACGNRGKLLAGLLKPSDRCFDDFISPMTNPVFFEDPRNLTEARIIFLNHKAPAAVGGGDVRLYAMQLRVKLSENVSLIATKDGYIDSSNPVIGDGWGDMAAGLKFNLLRDPNAGKLVSAGFTFELPTGEANALQANGDGELNLFLSAAWRLSDRSHWISAGGWRIPMDGVEESQSFYWSNHWDRKITDRLYLISELNWYHWTRAGQGGIAGVEGLDLFNFGSTGVAGNDIVTAAVGTKFKPSKHQEIGLAWEFPVTKREDIIENRLTFDWIIRF